MDNKLNRFFVYRDCGQTIRAKTFPKKCTDCNSKDIGELQIKWKN